MHGQYAKSIVPSFDDNRPLMRIGMEKKGRGGGIGMQAGSEDRYNVAL